MARPTIRRDDLFRLAGFCFLAFLILGSYAVARPASESLFLKAHGSQSLPYVWLLVTGGVFATVAIYNRYVARMHLLKLFAGVSAVTIAAQVLVMLAIGSDLPGAYYLLYLWKDIYIVVMVEMFWSFANSVYPIKSARWLYGLFCVAGSAGSVSGNLLVGKLAGIFGTVQTLWITIPVFLVVLVGCYLVSPRSGLKVPKASKTTPVLRQTYQVLKNSSYLTWMVVLVGLTQIAITLIDFQFNSVVEKMYVDTDVRTGVIGKVYAAINSSSVIFELAAGGILRLLGVPITLLLIPLALGGALLSFAAYPVFSVMAFVKVTSKAMDYSLFRIGKEILYIPLSYKEKTQGKSVIDVFTYRAAKGFASLIILLVIHLQVEGWVSYLTFLAVGIWILVQINISQRFRKKVSRKKELQG